MVIESDLNKYGEQGWHLCFIDKTGIGGRVLVFEKAIEDEPVRGKDANHHNDIRQQA